MDNSTNRISTKFYLGLLATEVLIISGFFCAAAHQLKNAANNKRNTQPLIYPQDISLEPASYTHPEATLSKD